jgi:heme/copper-type cytochrome/quinol oxidase subunit 2
MNGITERLANLDWKTVVVIVVVLVGLRYALIKQGSAAAKSIAEIAESLAIAMGLVFLVIRPLFICRSSYHRSPWSRRSL